MISVRSPQSCGWSARSLRRLYCWTIQSRATSSAQSELRPEQENLSYSWVRQPSKPRLRLEARAKPFITNPHDVLVKVEAASVNPIDVAMTANYGAEILGLYGVGKRLEKFGPSSLCNTQDSTLTDILGRDFSGTVISVGQSVCRFRPGDGVYGALHPSEPGTHAQYTLASEHDMAIKPQNLTHIEAAAVPYAALTFLSAFGSAGIHDNDIKPKRVFLNCGAGGIGTFAIQYLKATGCEVTVSVSSEGSDIVARLEPDHMLDYKSPTYEENLRQLAGFDAAFDAAGDESALSVVRPGGRFVTVVSPLLTSTDNNGVLLGVVQASATLAQKMAQTLYEHGVYYNWGFFSPDGAALDKIRVMIEKEQIRPIVDEVFPFTQVLDAYEKVGLRKGRGKVVIDMADNS